MHFLNNRRSLGKSVCSYPQGVYLFKVNNRNSRTRCKICSKLTTKAPERRYWCEIYFTPRSSVFIVNFEYVIAGWVGFTYQDKQFNAIIAIARSSPPSLLL